MQIVVAIVVFVLLFVVLFVVSAPLRADVHARRARDGEAPELDALEAAREAKYREIRDAELDFRTGKLSTEDYAATDGSLRAEAVEILDRLQTIEDRIAETAPDETAPGEASDSRGGASSEGEDRPRDAEPAEDDAGAATDAAKPSKANPEVEG
jgi:hypothetical protein